MSTFQLPSVQQLLKDAADQSDGQVMFTNDYSGRGMYGRSCVGIVGGRHACQEVIAAVLNEMTAQLLQVACDSNGIDREMVDARNLCNTVQSNTSILMYFTIDNMGHDVIMYWEQLEPLPDDDGLPSDEQFDEMGVIEISQWVIDHKDYVTEEDNLMNGGIRATAKLVRDRIREDHGDESHHHVSRGGDIG